MWVTLNLRNANQDYAADIQLGEETQRRSVPFRIAPEAYAEIRAGVARCIQRPDARDLFAALSRRIYDCLPEAAHAGLREAFARGGRALRLNITATALRPVPWECVCVDAADAEMKATWGTAYRAVRVVYHLGADARRMALSGAIFYDESLLDREGARRIRDAFPEGACAPAVVLSQSNIAEAREQLGAALANRSVLCVTAHGRVDGERMRILSERDGQPETDLYAIESARASGTLRVSPTMVFLDCCHLGAMASEPGRSFVTGFLQEGTTRALAANLDRVDPLDRGGSAVMARLIPEVLAGTPLTESIARARGTPGGEAVTVRQYVTVLYVRQDVGPGDTLESLLGRADERRNMGGTRLVLRRALGLLAYAAGCGIMTLAAARIAGSALGLAPLPYVGFFAFGAIGGAGLWMLRLRLLRGR